MSRTMKALLGVWIAALAGAAVWIGWDAWQGGRPAIGGPFSLTDQDGRTVTSDSRKNTDVPASGTNSRIKPPSPSSDVVLLHPVDVV